MRKRLVILGAGVVAAVLAVGGIAGVAAQTGEDTRSNPVSSFIDKLAANLGIGSDELKSAIDQTKDDMIDEAVANGRISPERGEELKQRSLDDALDRFDHFGGFGGFAERDGSKDGPSLRRMHAMPWLIFGRLDAAADIIGIDRAELVQELLRGKSLAQVAEEHGVSRDELKQGLLDRYDERLDEMLDRTFDFDWSGGAPSASPTAIPSMTPSGASSS